MTRTSTSSRSPKRPPISDDAFETSKLLVQLLQVGYPRRRHGPAGHSGRARLSPHAIRTAIHVYQHGALTIGQLAAGLGISQGWASRVVDEMERSGQLKRERDPHDRRIVRIRLSKAALDAVERSYRWRGEAVEVALASLPAEGRRAVRDFLQQVVEGLQE